MQGGGRQLLLWPEEGEMEEDEATLAENLFGPFMTLR